MKQDNQHNYESRDNPASAVLRSGFKHLFVQKPKAKRKTAPKSKK